MNRTESLPRISIVTPSYNQARYLPETIESILDQGYPNLEYMIIDGGSTDGSVEIIKRYERRLAFWVSEEDSGQSEAINKGFAKSTGELFAWVNSDDVLFPGCLRAIVSSYRRNNAPDIVHANVAYIDSKGLITRFVRIPKQSRFLFFRGIWYAQAPVVFFKSSSFGAVGGVNENYYQAMDFDLWMRLMKATARVSHVPRCLGAFRWHEHSKSFGSFLSPGAKREHHEDSEILSVHLPRCTAQTLSFWRCVYKAYRFARLDYLRAGLDLRRFCGAANWHVVAHVLGSRFDAQPCP